MELKKELLTTIYNIGVACGNSSDAREYGQDVFDHQEWVDESETHINSLKNLKDRLANQLLDDTNARYFGISNRLGVYNELCEYINAELNAWAECLEVEAV